MKSYYANKRKYGLLAIFLALFIIIAGLAACTVGSANISIMDSLKMIMQKVPFVRQWIGAEFSSTHQAIVLNLRLPRVILAALVGAGLAVSGAVFQGMFKNPMADPYVLGVSSGAALGATLAIILGLRTALGGMAWISIFAFCGAVVTIFMVYSLARGKTKTSVTALLLSGTAISSLITACISALMIFFRNRMEQVILWTMGSFSGAGWNDVLWALPLILLGIIVSHLFARDLNILLSGDESALHLGVNVEAVKKILLLTGSLTTAASVSVSGIIGFVGLMVPHIVRLLVGPDHRVLIPFSALAGALFLMITDTIARTAANPIEIPVGIITAIFGGPFFIYLLKRKKDSVV